MASEKLYEAAFQYRKSRIWKRLYDSELFAVALPDGETGYCSVTGMTGGPAALTLYVGVRGFNSYRSAVESMDPAALWMGEQEYLQCSLENQGYLREGELQEVRAYAERHGIMLQGACPQFSKYAPNRYPGPLETQQEEEDLGEALFAAAALAEILQTRRKAEIGLADIEEGSDTIPLLVRDGEHFRVDSATLPVQFPTPAELDKKAVSRIRSLQKSGILECEVLLGGEAGGNAPLGLLLCVESRQGIMLQVEPSRQYPNNADELLQNFLNALFQNKMCPRAIKIRDGRTRALLEDFCMKSGVLLAIGSDLDALDDMKESIFNTPNEDSGVEDSRSAENLEEARRLFAYLNSLPDRELKKLPPVTIDELMSLSAMGLIPPELDRRLKKLFRKS